jgi:hypothetical protein
MACAGFGYPRYYRLSEIPLHGAAARQRAVTLAPLRWVMLSGWWPLLPPPMDDQNVKVLAYSRCAAEYVISLALGVMGYSPRCSVAAFQRR